MRLFLPLVLLVPLVGCRKGPPLPVYWQVPAFQLTAQSGRPFDSKSLEGDIWVADFIFTTCPGPCPRMSSQMRGVQSAVASMPDVKLVSFTVDPKNDTPAILAAYATRYRAEPGRWFFLTGDRAALDVRAALPHFCGRLVVVRQRGDRLWVYPTFCDEMPEAFGQHTGLPGPGRRDHTSWAGVVPDRLELVRG